MSSSLAWAFLVIFAGLLSLGLLGVFVAAAYLLIQLGRANALEPEPAIPSRDAPGEEEEEESEEAKTARVLAMIDLAKGQGEMIVEDWKAEKRAEGWAEEDIQDFLNNRPLLELN